MNLKISSKTFPFLKIAEKSASMLEDSSIVLAPNGTGKTTICKILLENNPEDMLAYSYDQGIQPTYRILEGKAKGFEISPTPKEFEEVQRQLEDLKLDLETQKKIGRLFKKTDLKNAPSIFSEAWDGGILDSLAPLKNEQRKNLEPLLSADGQDLIIALKKRGEICAIAEEERRHSAELLAKQDIASAYSMIDLGKHEHDIRKNGCPFCGGRGATGNVYEDMLKRQKELDIEKVAIFKECSFFKNIYDPTKILSLIDAAIVGLKSLSDEQFLTLLFTNGDADCEKKYEKEIAEYKNTEEKYKALVAKRDEKFNEMKEAYSFLSKGFSDKYIGCSLNLDEKKKIIKLTTKRAPGSYSEGEKHDMFASIMELTALGSSKPYLLVDDPLTELDAANEYKMVFRFIQMAKKKKVIIFTCNANLINIATKQCANQFKLFYLESHKDADENLECRLLPMEFGDQESGKPYLTLEKASLFDSETLWGKVAKMVADRAIAMLKTSEEANSKTPVSPFVNEVNKLLHYDSSFESEKYGISNESLVKYVEEFKAPEEVTFLDTMAHKIALLASLRVYVEKKLYEYNQGRIKAKHKDLELENEQLLSCKLLKVDNQKDYPVTDFYPNWDRKMLMRAKTMLNDNEHPYGLATPLFFAIAIGWDDYLLEINTLKWIFQRS